MNPVIQTPNHPVQHNPATQHIASAPATPITPVVLPTPVELPKEIIVSRNGISWLYVQALLKSKKEGDVKRYSFVPADVNDKVPGRDAKSYLTHIGEDEVLSFATGKHRGCSTLWHKYATKVATTDDKGEETGVFDVSKFVEAFADNASKFSARGETFTSLLGEMEDLRTKMISLASDKSVAPMDKIAQMEKLGVRMTEIQNAIDEKKAKKQNDEDND